MNTFDEIMKYCPFLKELIESKINEEVTKAKEKKQQEINKLKSSVEGLTATLLMGGE